MSKSYISQVKNGKRPPSDRLIEALSALHDSTPKGKSEANCRKAVDLFLESRRDGLSKGTVEHFYKQYLAKAIPVLGVTPTPAAITKFLNSLSCSQGGKHAYFRAMRAFYRWLYSPRSGFDLRGKDNPMAWVDAPKIPKLILPSLTVEQVQSLIAEAPSVRDKAIIALFAESGLRLSELTNVKLGDIDWQNRIIRVLGKGNKEGYAPFGSLAEQHLKAWLAQCPPDQDNIWGLKRWGIVEMLKTLKKKTGLPVNPHTFRRTFASLLRKVGVDSLVIRDLGRWQNVQMVERYSRSVTFMDALKFYRPELLANTPKGI